MKKIIFFVLIVLAVSCSKTGLSQSSSPAVTGNVSNITFSSATISGQAKIDGSVSSDIKFGILLSKSSGILYGNATEVQATAFDSNYKFDVLIENLDYNTTYYYRTYIYQNGTVDYGETKSFKTSDIPETIDLGLSVKWRSYNLGATKPEEVGKYFAWGDVTGQTWNGSVWSNGGFAKEYTYKLDSNDNLQLEYDAARVMLGNNWRMPTLLECQELIDNCKKTWVEDYLGTGTKGVILTSNIKGYTSNYIFLPVTGYGGGIYLESGETLGCYYSSTISKVNKSVSSYLAFTKLYLRTEEYIITIGRPIRPVTK